MRLLLDTHVAIWVLIKPSLIPPGIRTRIDEQPAELFVSSVSIFQISTKFKLKRNDSPPFNRAEVTEFFEEMHFDSYRWRRSTRPSSIGLSSFTVILSTDYSAQAIAEPMYLASDDTKIALYDCPRIPWE